MKCQVKRQWQSYSEKIPVRREAGTKKQDLTRKITWRGQTKRVSCHHTVFDDPTSPDAAPRESIEVRALVFFAPEEKDAEQVAVTALGSSASHVKHFEPRELRPHF